MISPTQYMTRVTTKDVAVGDTTIPAGERVVLLIAAANRDDAEFPDPDATRVPRPEGRSLAFGWGPHKCLGQWFARVAAQAALAELYERFPDLHVDGEQADWRASGNVRRLHGVPASCPVTGA